MKLSILVVSFNMGREIPRTLTSLSRDYQRGIQEIQWISFNRFPLSQPC